MGLQSKLDYLYLEREQGVSIRSCAKWIEEGEKISSYFNNVKKIGNKGTLSVVY